MMPKIKITYEGQPCRKCQTPVINVETGRTEPRPGSVYGYSGYFLCPNNKCNTMYMDDSRRVYKETSPKAPPALSKDFSKLEKQQLYQEVAQIMNRLLNILKKEAGL